MKKFFTTCVASAVCAAVMLCGCSAGKGDRINVVTDDDKALDGDIVMTVGDSSISQADFNFIYKLVYDNMSQYAMYYGDDWENMAIEDDKTMADFMRENTVEQIKQMAAAVELGKEHGIKTDKDVQKTITEQKKNLVENNYGGVDGYRKYLIEAHTTDTAFDRYLEICEIYSRLSKELSKKGGVLNVDEDKLAEDFVADNADKLKVQHILISTQAQQEGEDAPHTDEEAQKLANEIIAKLDGGADFDSLIEEYNEDPGMSKGKFYLFGDGEMVEEFENASKELAIGEYTKAPVKTSYGYHIIKRYEITADGDEFDEYKENASSEKLMELIEEKIEKLDVKTEEKAIKKYLKKWAEERAAEAEANETAASNADNESGKE